MMRCARCHRTLTREPVIVNGSGYGSSCARKVKEPDLVEIASKRARVVTRRRVSRADLRQLELEAAA